MGLSFLIFAGSIASWALFEIWVNHRDGGETDKKRDKKTKRSVVAYVLLAIFVGCIFTNIPLLLIPLNGSLRFALGTLVIWSGIFLRFWSIQTLGRYFRTTVMIQKNHKVVRTGPYRFVRHPSYAACFVILLGIGVGLGSLVGFLLMLGLAMAGFNQRMAVEETELTKSLGKEYSDYMGQTKRLIPLIY